MSVEFGFDKIRSMYYITHRRDSSTICVYFVDNFRKFCTLINEFRRDVESERKDYEKKSICNL